MHKSTSTGQPIGRLLWRSLLGAGAATLAIVSLLLGFLTPGAQASTRPHQAAASTAGSYVPVTPARIADTRTGSGMPNAGQTLTAGGTLKVQVTGAGGIPTTGVCAAVLNVTDAGSTASGFLTVFPTGATQPLASNLNFVPNQIVADQATVPVGTGGQVSIFNHAGSTNVVVDVDGYYTCNASPASAGLYDGVSPTRVLGTLASGAAIATNTSMAVSVTGTATGVPATASAVVVNLTAAGGTSASFLTAYAAGSTRPLGSNLNFPAGQTVANRATVAVGTGGQIEVYNHTGTVNVDVDVDGYYTGTAGTPGSAFFPVTPVRLTDTRSSTNGTPMTANSTEKFALTNSVIPASAAAVQTNITVVPGTAAGFLTVYPTSDTTAPVASDVNWVGTTLPPATAEGIPNVTIADTAGTGNIEMYNGPAVGGGTVNIVIDASGYFATPATTNTVAVTASPTSVQANGAGAASVSATVTTPTGTVVTGDTVTFAASGSPSGSCGTLSSTTAATNASGTATVSYLSSTTAGFCTITATESGTGGSGSAMITQTLAPAATNTIAVNSFAGSGTATATVTPNVAGDPVIFTPTSSACGTFANSGAVATNASGVATDPYTAANTATSCTYTATEANGGQTSTAGTITQTATT